MIVTFSDHLKQLMERGGLTKAELARRAGLSHVAIGNYLNGRIPRFVEADKLATALGITTDYLLNPGRLDASLAIGSKVAKKAAAVLGLTKDQQQVLFEAAEEVIREQPGEYGAIDWRQRALDAEAKLEELKAKLAQLSNQD